tara:strand:- start:9690 stop:9929 length:240 start_codon:yes stop_codon:yes gene_type:complete
MIDCIKCKVSKESIEVMNFKGDLGVEIKKSVCNECFLEWENDMQMKVMNEYRLDLSNKEHRDFLIKKMKEFFTLIETEL